MAGHSISGAADPVIICTSGILVLLDTSFYQPISAFEFIPTLVPVTYESSHAPNIFPVLVMPNNPLRPTYGRDVPTHPNEEFDHCLHRSAPVVTPSPISVFEYLEW